MKSGADTLKRSDERVLRANRIHPFPARMAPEIAIEKVERLSKPGASVLDPMCGSGTVIHAAANTGRRPVGVDLDPLAVMLTRVASTPALSLDLEKRAKEIVKVAKRKGVKLPDWIERSDRSVEFVEFWFAAQQREDLSRLARTLASLPLADDALRVAMSRTIITKDGGVSLARDTSHSRPHRVRLEAHESVFDLFVAAAGKIERAISRMKTPTHAASVTLGDARELRQIPTSSVDLIVTSPPYLNAIDYLRGHRLSLVWLGHLIEELKVVRSGSRTWAR
jgi:adenine-specific DNA methylase